MRNKINNGSRYFIVNKLPKYIPFYLVVEYPKSGGTWLGQLVSSYLNIPFPRNVFPKLSESVIHGHYFPSKRSRQIKKILFMIRDGRDVAVSFYYHSLLWNEKNRLNPKDVYYARKKLGFSDYNDIKRNLPVFIEFLFEHKPPGFIKFQYEGDWAKFNEKWLDYSDSDNSNIFITRYEDLLDDTEKEITKLIGSIGPDEKIDEQRIKEVVNLFEFKNQAKRSKGSEETSSFLRKGIKGDWKNKFSKEASEIFNYYAGDMLIQLGYEKDSSWINEVAAE